ncbi:MAG: RNA-binding S4 domain-containing protein [Armatimonadetes bacterium]|nr:RNA-binding S4 domain-containing protein [Armatimonadota bacterium]
MRLDKWLKVSGLIPRRTVANEACDAGKVLVNGKLARASLEVSAGDQVEFDLGRGTTRVQILLVPTSNVSRERQITLYDRCEG